MSTPAACLLLSQFVPATAQLFAVYRRLRDALPADTASTFAVYEKKIIHHDMMTLVRMCACHPRLLKSLQSCKAHS